MTEEGLVTVFIVEDELLVLEDIAYKLSQFGYAVSGEYTKGEEVLEALNSGNIPDLILMDVHLDGSLDGIRTVELLSQQFHIPVIYLTDDHHKDTIIRASKTKPINYIVKPFSQIQLKTAIELCIFENILDDDPDEDYRIPYRVNDAIFIKDKGKFVKIAVENIIRLEGDRMYTDIITSGKTFKVSGSLKKIRKNFTDPFFVKIHRSHVVNVNQITGFEGSTVFLPKGTVTVSKQYREHFFKRFRII